MLQKQRIGYIDAIRGFTMLLVVFSHIETFCYHINFDQSILSSLFITFRMPMFFFISGYIAYKKETWDFNTYKKKLTRKALIQIIPTLVFFHLYFTICHDAPINYFITEGPLGFWFTIVLFEMYFIYYSILLLCRNNDKVNNTILIIIAILGQLIYIGGIGHYYDLGKYPLLSLINLSRYISYFILGHFCRKYSSIFQRLISNDKIKTILIISFITLFILEWKKYLLPDFSILHVINYEIFIRWIGLLMVFAIFYHYRTTFDQDSIISKPIRFIGRHTLDIYLLHYFLLPELSFMKEWLINNQNIAGKLVITLLFSLIIIAICLLISYIIRSSQFLGHTLWGAKYKI